MFVFCSDMITRQPRPRRYLTDRDIARIQALALSVSESHVYWPRQAQKSDSLRALWSVLKSPLMPFASATQVRQSPP